MARSAIITTESDYTAHLRPPTAAFHITVVTKDELRGKSVTKILPNFDIVDTHQILPVGIGGHLKTGVFYVVIIWAAGQTLRKKFGLPPKQFHITLSAHDDHHIDKGVDSLLPGHFPQHPSPDLLDHLIFTLHLSGQFAHALLLSIDLCKVAPDSERGFVRLGDAALKEALHKLSMLSFAGAFQRCSDQKVQEYCVRKIEECSEFTEWGCVFADAERSQLPVEIAEVLFTPWSPALLECLSSVHLRHLPSLCIPSREPAYIPFRTRRSGDAPSYRLPRFFRWLVPFHLAIMSTPREALDIDTLASPHLRIRHVLTLTEETPLHPEWFARKGIRNTFVPIPNFHPPTIEQMDLVMRLLDDADSLPMLIHCSGGKGRAGTVAACYLVAYGFAKPQPNRRAPTMTAKEAISALQAIRPGSIETEQQEAFVSKYCSTIWKRQRVVLVLASEPPTCPLIIEGTLATDSDLFILVGLPGSGKSYFSRPLLARNQRSWTHISQDDTGSRSACETAIGNGRGHGRILLDRCNTSLDDRKEWLRLSAHWASTPVCMWFDYGREVCTSRAQNRAAHPTLPPGNRVRNAVEQMQKAFVRPSLAEGFKAVAIIRSFAAAVQLVARLSPPISLLKYPRTAHVLNLGAASSDDIVSSIPLIPEGTNVVITEKMDGANMGFSLPADRSQILVQNRSHYINPTSHEQFKKLGLWLDRRRDDLHRVLDRDPYFPQRYILYGEWLAATHSVEYSRLPDWFMAFDLYDRSCGQWTDRRTLEMLLLDTGIQMVPVLHDGGMLSEQELKDMVQRPSQYCDGRVEGVYVKIEKDGWVLTRGKVVRDDFVAGNEHWTRGSPHMNALHVEIDEDNK